MGKIIIKGNKKFIETTKEALNLLKEKDYLSYKVIIKNIEVIHQSEKTNFNPFLNKQVAFISTKSSKVDITWYASQILHESYHGKLYNDAIEEEKNPIEAYQGYEAEMYCLTKQIECLKKLEAPNYLIEYAISFYGQNWWDRPLNKQIHNNKRILLK